MGNNWQGEEKIPFTSISNNSKNLLQQAEIGDVETCGVFVNQLPF